jgi:hypothetical protein
MPNIYTVCFCGTACSRDEGEVTRYWARRSWQVWMKEQRLKSDMDIYCKETGYIPVRIHKDISGSLRSDGASVTVRGVGENDWSNQHAESDELLDIPLGVPSALRGYVQSYSRGNQRSVPSQVTGWAAAALALHGANLAARSNATQYNFIGHSRGAVEAIMAAWFIYAYGGNRRTYPINIFAIDPVPGTGNWYGILTQLPPNVANYVGVYAWDHLDVGFSALVPRPNASMTGLREHRQIEARGVTGAWSDLADSSQLADPLAASDLPQPSRYDLFACRGRHGTVAGNCTFDGLYDGKHANVDVEPVPKLVYKLARAYLTKWGTTFRTRCRVQTSALELRRKIHTAHTHYDAMGGGETRTSMRAGRPYVRQISSIRGRATWNTYYLEDVVGDPPYRLAYPVTTERRGGGWVKWRFL